MIHLRGSCYGGRAHLRRSCYGGQALIFALGATKSFIRFRAISSVLKTSRLDLLAHIFLWPFASLLYLYNAIIAGFSRRLTWRGITYELKSPHEAVIISRDS